MYTAYLLTTDVHNMHMYVYAPVSVHIYILHACKLFVVWCLCLFCFLCCTQRSLHILKFPELVAVTTVDVPSQCLHLIRSGVPQVHVQQVQACDPTVCTFRCTYVQYVYIHIIYNNVVCILCMYSI